MQLAISVDLCHFDLRNLFELYYACIHAFSIFYNVNSVSAKKVNR